MKNLFIFLLITISYLFAVVRSQSVDSNLLQHYGPPLTIIPQQTNKTILLFSTLNILTKINFSGQILWKQAASPVEKPLNLFLHKEFIFTASYATRPHDLTQGSYTDPHKYLIIRQFTQNGSLIGQISTPLSCVPIGLSKIDSTTAITLENEISSNSFITNQSFNTTCKNPVNYVQYTLSGSDNRITNHVVVTNITQTTQNTPNTPFNSFNCAPQPDHSMFISDSKRNTGVIIHPHDISTTIEIPSLTETIQCWAFPITSSQYSHMMIIYIDEVGNLYSHESQEEIGMSKIEGDNKIATFSLSSQFTHNFSSYESLPFILASTVISIKDGVMRNLYDEIIEQNDDSFNFFQFSLPFLSFLSPTQKDKFYTTPLLHDSLHITITPAFAGLRNPCNSFFLSTYHAQTMKLLSTHKFSISPQIKSTKSPIKFLLHEIGSLSKRDMLSHICIQTSHGDFSNPSLSEELLCINTLVLLQNNPISLRKTLLSSQTTSKYSHRTDSYFSSLQSSDFTLIEFVRDSLGKETPTVSTVKHNLSLGYFTQLNIPIGSHIYPGFEFPVTISARATTDANQDPYKTSIPGLLIVQPVGSNHDGKIIGLISSQIPEVEVGFDSPSEPNHNSSNFGIHSDYISTTKYLKTNNSMVKSTYHQLYSPLAHLLTLNKVDKQNIPVSASVELLQQSTVLLKTITVKKNYIFPYLQHLYDSNYSFLKNKKEHLDDFFQIILNHNDGASPNPSEHHHNPNDKLAILQALETYKLNKLILPQSVVVIRQDDGGLYLLDIITFGKDIDKNVNKKSTLPIVTFSLNFLFPTLFLPTTTINPSEIQIHYHKNRIILILPILHAQAHPRLTHIITIDLHRISQTPIIIPLTNVIQTHERFSHCEITTSPFSTSTTYLVCFNSLTRNIIQLNEYMLSPQLRINDGTFDPANNNLDDDEEEDNNTTNLIQQNENFLVSKLPAPLFRLPNPLPHDYLLSGYNRFDVLSSTRREIRTCQGNPIIPSNPLVIIPSKFESTSIICMYGIDFFCTELIRDGGFDRLSSNPFKWSILILSMFIVFVVTLWSRHKARVATIQNQWR